MTVHGVDVSSYQSATYSTTGLDFVFTKVTEGLSYINSRWLAQRDRARKAGLVWGAYHYPHMANDPVAEADFFLRQVAWKPGDIIVLDWEGYDSANKGVSKSRQLAYRDAWLKYVKGKMPGHRVGIYCNADYWLNVDQTSNCGDFLWIATAGRAAGAPGIQHPWRFHQYSTAGGIDHDVANFPSRAALAAWASGGNTPEDEMQLSDKVAIGDWLKEAWPADKGLQDGSISVETALGSGYGHARRAAENTTALVAQLAALTAVVGKLTEGGGLDAAAVQAAAEAGARAALAELGDKLQEV
jgi:hypothetical protein